MDAVADLEAWLRELDVPAKVDGMTTEEVMAGLSAALGRKCSPRYASVVIRHLIAAGLWEHAGERASRRNDGQRCWLPVYRPKPKGKGVK